jgi:hypothetical protein
MAGLNLILDSMWALLQCLPPRLTGIVLRPMPSFEVSSRFLQISAGPGRGQQCGLAFLQLIF